jgi:hypothetical protein
LSTLLQLPKHRVIADHRAQTVQESLSRSPAGRMPKLTDNLPDTCGATCKRTRNRGDLVRERPARTSRRQTSPAANQDSHRNLVSMGRG